MKTLKLKVLTVTMMVAASAMVACSKGGGDSVASTPLNALSGCVSGCPSGGVPIMNLATSTGSPDSLSFGFTVVGNAQNYGGGYGGGYGYQQQIAMGGTAQVQGSQSGSVFAGGNCIIPPGTYQVTTLQGATMQGNSFGYIRLRAQGTYVAMDISISNGYISGSRIGMGAYLTIESVNNQQCGYGMNQFWLN